MRRCCARRSTAPRSIRNPNAWDRALYRVRRSVIGWLGGAAIEAAA